MKKFYIIIFLAIALNSCSSFCYDYKRRLEGEEYKFKITSKTIDNRYITLKGLNIKGDSIIFNEGIVWDIYDSIEVGDTLYKPKETADLTLIKKDTTMVFEYLCGGQHYYN